MKDIKSPSHYTEFFPFEVNDAICLILDSPLCEGLSRSQSGHLYAELKYRFRAGLKEGNSAEKDIGKAMQFSEFRKDNEIEGIVR